MKIIWKFINGQYLEYLIIFLNPSMLFFKKNHVYLLIFEMKSHYIVKASLSSWNYINRFLIYLDV